MNAQPANKAQAYWERNLDPRNLGVRGGPERDLAREWAFYDSDEQRFAASRMPPLRGALCLEIGAGLGTHALWLANQGACVAVLDYSAARLAAVLREARRLGVSDRILPMQAAAEALPFAANRFDLVYTKSVLIHTHLPEALAEARRVLKPEAGRAIFLEPQDRNPFAVLYRRLFAPKEWQGITRYFDEWSAGEVERAFPGAETRDFYLFGFLAFVWQFKWPVLSLFRWSLALARLIDRPLLTLAPALRKYAWFRVFVGKKEAEGRG
ncbi:MAG: class I SAM-dependent methyltransferase [Candidatus Sumerlaeota bacterium]|nr:class I SAM-dependent methyltransferase [Candidatus Sumerlaeota bacterium]